MIAVDTSVAVAAFAVWHPRHHEAGALLRAEQVAISVHSLLETYSVLTRLPREMRVHPSLVADHLQEQYPDEPLSLPPDEQQELPGRLAPLGISGGAVYDALIGATAKAATATLVSADRRAQRVYAALGVEVRPL